MIAHTASIRRLVVCALLAVSLQTAAARAQCSGNWQAYGSGTNGAYVLALTSLPNGNLVAGGQFTTAGGAPANHVARWNGSAWLPLASGMAGGSFATAVFALAAMPNGDLIAGGDFATAGGVTVRGIARWNGAAWSPLGSGMTWGTLPAAVYALLVLPNGDLIAGGDFNTAGGVAAQGIARWNGSAWQPFGAGIAGQSVSALALLPNGDIVAGGDFFMAGGGLASNVARWNGSSWSPLGAGTNSPVAALAVLPNGDLVVGGGFSSAGGAANTVAIARWSGNAWQSFGGGMNGQVFALAVRPSGEVFVGGHFTSAGGTPANRIARGAGGAWQTLGSGLNHYVYALAPLPGDAMAVGGQFTQAGGVSASHVARWSRPATIDFLTPPYDVSICPGDTALFTCMVDGDAPLSFQWRRDGVSLGDGPTGTGSIVVGSATSDLAIVNASSADVGSYDCVITDLCGSAASFPYSLVMRFCLLGDMNCDGALNNGDIDPFILALLSPAEYQAAHPQCNIAIGDMNGDGMLDNGDIDPFVQCLLGGCD